MKTVTLRLLVLSAMLPLALVTPAVAQGADEIGLVVQQTAGVTTLSLDGAGRFTAPAIR